MKYLNKFHNDNAFGIFDSVELHNARDILIKLKEDKRPPDATGSKEAD